MLNISYSPYILTPVKGLNSVFSKVPRRGALLKVKWADKKVGYADCLPWPEFGDPSIEDHLESIKNGKLTTLVEQAIWLARRDANARSMKVSLFDGILKLKNNYLVTDMSGLEVQDLDNLKSNGVTKIKIKVGKDFDREIDFIKKAANRGFFLRLDFNSSGNWQSFEKIISVLGQTVKSRIDYVEDPFRFVFDEWLEAKKLVPLALDREYANVDWENLERPPFDVVIIKPAVIDVDEAIDRMKRFNLKATVTTNMDHPVGAHAFLGVGI